MGGKKITLSSFLERATVAHGSKYDYSSVAFTEGKDKVSIRCPRHGLFKQGVSSHLSGIGCPNCGRIKATEKIRLDEASFLARAQEAHGGRYDYSQAVYMGLKTPLSIICPEHGLFKQAPHTHLKSYGCRKCGHSKGAGKRSRSLIDFLARAQEAHGGRYDYSQVEYKNSNAKIKIGCPEHGIFEQLAISHIGGHGCRKCAAIITGASNADNLDGFIAKAVATHGDYYDYSQVTYKNNRTGVKIVCPTHGAFEQTPNSHLCGAGCRACAYQRNSEGATLEHATFLEKAQEVHGHKYDYSLTQYTGGKCMIKIICSVHGEFEQRPNSHLAGRGCMKCGQVATGQAMSITQEEFLTRAHNRHGSRYDYSKVEYEGAHKKVLIGCAKHGFFSQKPGGHLSGRGCYKCRKSSPRLLHSEFLQRAHAQHGDLYDYSQAGRINSSVSLVKIVCKKHGAFRQKAISHYRGSGCPLCGRERTNAQVRLSWVEQAAGRKATLYFLRIYDDQESFYKVGITVRSVAWRYRQQRHLQGYKYEVLAQHQSTNAAAVYDWEQSILETFAHLKYNPSTHFDGQSECFSSCEEILEIFPL